MTAVTEAAVRETLGALGLDEQLFARSIADAQIDRIDGGVNEVFSVDTGQTAPGSLIGKFGTRHSPAHLRAGIGAIRSLDHWTSVPVPAIYASAFDRTPPVVVSEYCPGTPLADGFDDTERLTDPAAVRLLGEVIRAIGEIPATSMTGYGRVQSVRRTAAGPQLTGEFETFREWVLAYADRCYSNPPAHDGLQRIAPGVPAFLEERLDELPTAPTQSVVITDFSPENLLTPDGTVPASSSGLSGLIDLDGAKIGPPALTAVNAEYLLTRGLSAPTPVRRALYEPLPFGPAVSHRRYYRLLALGRSVAALSCWYDPTGSRFQQRAATITTELDRFVGSSWSSQQSME